MLEKLANGSHGHSSFSLHWNIGFAPTHSTPLGISHSGLKQYLALGKHIKQSQGTVQITAKKDGRYEYCFSNQMSTVVDKMVRYVSLSQAERAPLHMSSGCSFNVHGVIYVDDEGKYSLLEGLKRSNLMAP